MRKELLTHQDPKSPVSEVFRTLRTNIQFMNTDRKLKSLLITSTFPEEGKSWVTSNLAVTFAQAGKKVILVDADMRKGRQYKIFGLLPKPGLSNYLSNMDAENNETNEINIATYIQATEVENLHVLVAGNVPPNPSELLVSSRMLELLQELKSMCDLVIIDGTPCDLVTDSVILSRMVDSTIVVTAQKETKKDNLVRVVKNIQNVGGKVAGIVVNKVDISTRKYNQSYYYGSISGERLTKKSKTNKIIESIGNLFNNKKNSAEREKEESKKIDEMLSNLYKNQNNNEEVENHNNNEEVENHNNYNEDVKKNNQVNDKLESYRDNDNNDNINITNINEANSNTPESQNTEQNDAQQNLVENEPINNGQENLNQNVQTDQSIFSDQRTNEILKQVNEYLESEKRKLEEKN